MLKKQERLGILNYVCSTVREPAKALRSIEQNGIVDKNTTPKIGDLVLCCVADNSVGYGAIEVEGCVNVPLQNGDVFIGVIGSRKSGTSVFGEVPQYQLEKGNALQLLSIGGIVGKCICPGNTQTNGKPTELTIKGFIKGDNDNIANMADYKPSLVVFDSQVQQAETIFVFGTSAEVGKTTLVKSIIRNLKNLYPNKKICGIKIVGTGRLADITGYLYAGADLCLDYTDAGIPSTYDIPPDRFDDIFIELYDYAKATSDVIILEVGGDLLEGNADRVIRFSQSIPNSKSFLMCNDAMGAAMGAQIFKDFNAKSPIFATWKQNTEAFRERMMCEFVINTSNNSDIIRGLEVQT